MAFMIPFDSDGGAIRVSARAAAAGFSGGSQKVRFGTGFAAIVLSGLLERSLVAATTLVRAVHDRTSPNVY
jgi:hypothetical protein